MKYLSIAIIATLPALSVPAFAADKASSGPSSSKAMDTNRSMGQKFDDASITTKLKRKLVASPSAPGLSVNVSTNQGVVTLVGTVKTEADRQNAERIAKETEGVQKVNNKLVISADTDRSAGEKLADASITTKVKSKLVAESNTPGFGINVSTNQGVVTLEGTVESEAQRQNVEAVARSTNGVQEVTNKLIVSN